MSVLANNLNKVGLVLGFIGGLMMAVDLLGTRRAEQAEQSVQNLVAGAVALTKGLFRMTMVEPIKGALPAIAAIGVVAFWALVFYLLSLPFADSSAPHRILLTLSLVLAVPAGVLISLAILIWLPLILLVLSGAWIYCVLVWAVGSPLIAGAALSQKYGLKGAVPTTGIILVALAFLLQLIATFVE